MSDSSDGPPQVILIGSGSELSACIEAHRRLTDDGIATRVVSMPSWELFEDQDEAYRDSVFPPEVAARVAVEAGCEQGWAKYIGINGRFIGMQGFGASAPYAELLERFGITPTQIIEAAKSLVK